MTKPLWFRLLAAVLVFWNAMGVVACIQQVRLGADAMGEATAYDRALYASMPFWYDWVYAVATLAGLAGTLALLAGRRIAKPLLAISLLAVLVQFGYLFATSDIIAAKGAWTAYFPILIVAVCVVQLWLSDLAARLGWIR